MNQKRKTKGFTIIEVVLVLAIAGLIFLMVFIALPALQRAQRDTQRKNDLSRAITALTSYTSNNRGALPTDTAAGWNAFTTKYLTIGGDTFMDPTGANYIWITPGVPATVAAATFSSATPNIYVTTGSVCNGEVLTTGQGSRKVAFQTKLEGGGIACASN